MIMMMMVQFIQRGTWMSEPHFKPQLKWLLIGSSPADGYLRWPVDISRRFCGVKSSCFSHKLESSLSKIVATKTDIFQVKPWSFLSLTQPELQHSNQIKRDVMSNTPVSPDRDVLKMQKITESNLYLFYMKHLGSSESVCCSDVPTLFLSDILFSSTVLIKFRVDLLTFCMCNI